MRILLVAATTPEVAPLVSKLDGAAADGSLLHGYWRGSHHVDVMITGVGMVATAVWCSRALVARQDGAPPAWDFALNLGVCGSFDSALPPGAVVHVVADRIAELGAEDGDAFLTIADLKLPSEHIFINAAPPLNPVLSRLPAVSGITVNTVHGSERSIAAVVERFKPQVESMEGAAFAHACSAHGLPYAQVRAVSNLVERRNRGAWKMAEAIEHLASVALEILDHA